MTDPDYTLVDTPGGVWECGECGALVIQCSVHTDWHHKQVRLTVESDDLGPIDWTTIESENRPGWFNVHARRAGRVGWGFDKDVSKARSRAYARLRASELGWI